MLDSLSEIVYMVLGGCYAVKHPPFYFQKPHRGETIFSDFFLSKSLLLQNLNSKRPSRMAFFFSKIWIQKHTIGEDFFFSKLWIQEHPPALEDETPTSPRGWFWIQFFVNNPRGCFQFQFFEKEKPPLEGISGFIFLKKKVSQRVFLDSDFWRKKGLPYSMFWKSEFKKNSKNSSIFKNPIEERPFLGFFLQNSTSRTDFFKKTLKGRPFLLQRSEFKKTL